MHIVIHTQYYPPEIGAPQARLCALANGLVNRQHRVTILTAMPNYPQGVIHEGYGGWFKKEDIGNVQILRARIVPINRSSLTSRLVSYFSFVFSSFWVGLMHLHEVDFILTESPPLFLGISGYLLGLFKNSRWIFNVSDLWPESAVRLGIIKNRKSFSSWMGYRMEAFFYQKAWCVSGQSQSILKNILDRFPSIHTYHLSNGADVDLFKPENNSRNLRYQLGGEVLALYAGLHGLAQGLDQVLYSADQLQRLPQLKFILIGDGPLKKKLVTFAGELKLDNVVFLDPVPRKEMPDILAGADFCLVPLGLDLPGAVPSKLYEAMSSGKPVILMADGEAADIVRDNHCGLVVSPGDLVGLTNAIRQLTEDGALRKQLGTNGHNAVVKQYDRSVIVEKFALFLESNE